MKHNTVLIIEDNETNRKLFKTLLRMAEYHVLEAEDARTGIRLVREQRPDLVLMDIQLPGMDGFSATRLIKSDPEFEDIPIVALTALAMAADERKAMEAGCDGYISKPIDTRDFIETITSFLSGNACDVKRSPKENLEYRSKILIVDDEPLNVKLLAAQLTSDKHEVIRAYSGAEALEKISEKPPDVILLDIMMPGMDGFEVARRVKGNPETGNIPIIMVTALDNRDNKEKALEAGADEFLNKPVNTEELLSRINSMLCLKHCKDGVAVRKRCERFLKVQKGLEEIVRENRRVPSVLLLEDSDQDARLIRSYLQGEPYRVIHARDGREARSCLRREKIDLILLDILLPDINGIEICRDLKEKEETRNIQVVVITCLEDMENKVKCLELGVDDYLVKPIDHRELKARLRTLLKKKEYLDLLQSSYKAALDSAVIDPLTGTYNHAYFRHFLDFEVKRSLRYQYPIALILISVEDLETREEASGPLGDDGIWRELAQVVAGNFRETDLLARYGDARFAVVLQYLDKECGIRIAEGIRESIASHTFRSEPALPAGGVRARTGIAFCPKDAATPEALIQKAEEMLNPFRNQEENILCDQDGGPVPEPEDRSLSEGLPVE